MNIKNYTSEVPVHVTVSRIEQVLAKAGAASVTKEYAPDASLAALRFTLETPAGGNVVIRLPANPDNVFKAMSKEVHRPRTGTFDRLREQASRTAWKLMQDWIEVQVSLIHMQQAEPMEVFLPYILTAKNETIYQQIKASQYKALLTE